MKTKDFMAAIEGGFRKAYDNHPGMSTVPYIDARDGEVKECLAILLTRTEHFAVIVAHAAHWIAEDQEAIFEHGRGGDPEASILDTIEDFMNLVTGMKTAKYMDWTAVYFPGLTEEQVLGESEAGHDPMLITDTADGRDPVTGIKTVGSEDFLGGIAGD